MKTKYTVSDTGYTSRIARMMDNLSDCDDPNIVKGVYDGMMFIKDDLWGCKTKYAKYRNPDNCSEEEMNKLIKLINLDGYIVMKGITSFDPDEIEYCYPGPLYETKVIEYKNFDSKSDKDSGEVIVIDSFDCESG
jgi:hypothetical protein